jgi:hypothetical protein
MNAHKIETILSEDGTLTLKGLPFHAGDAVEVIILERSPNILNNDINALDDLKICFLPKKVVFPSLLGKN